MSGDQYFRRLQNRVAATTGRPTNNGSLLTQVQQQGDQQDGRGVTIHISEDEIREQVRRIRQEPMNTSPNDPAALRPLLPAKMPSMRGRKCLVLDVDETLVHSSYQPTREFDLHLPLSVDNKICNVYVAFRPHVHHFLRTVSHMFEIVIFTASVSIYCDPLMDFIDKNNDLGKLRLFREHCSYVQGSHVKDLSLLGRKLDEVVIIDNSPIAYLFQQRNAIPIISWFNDPSDEELLKLIPVLEDIARADTVYDVLDPYNARLQLEKQRKGR